MGNEQSQMKSISFNEKPVEKGGNLLVFEAEDNNAQITVLEVKNLYGESRKHSDNFLIQTHRRSITNIFLTTKICQP